MTSTRGRGATWWAEGSAQAAPLRQVKDLYVLMDRDADGYLTVDEFAQYFGSGEVGCVKRVAEPFVFFICLLGVVP